MQLNVASRDDFRQIARQVYDLWSAGLSKERHRYLLGSTYYHPWSKKNNYRLVYKHKDTVVVSCKVLHLPLFVKGKIYQIFGLGAIFTNPAWRNQKLASKLIRSAIERAQNSNFDALFLFSDLDQFYSSFGFIPLGNLDFELNPQNYEIATNNHLPRNYRFERLTLEDKDEKFSFSLNSWFTSHDLIEIINCHRRWLSREPYNILRSYNYFSFQLAKQLYMANHSKKNKPLPNVLLLKEQENIKGYAITEYSGINLRILEIIGDDISRALLWQKIIEEAQNKRCTRISGFEAITRDFVPYIKLDSELLNIRPSIKTSHILCHERSWGQPMYLPLNQELENLHSYNPCPLLEFDFF